MVEVKSQPNASLIATYSNDTLALTANVRKSGDVFDIIVIDAISGEEVLSTRRQTKEEAEKLAFGLMKPTHDPSAVHLRAE